MNLNRIKSVLADKGITAKEVSRMLGLKSTTVYNWTQNRSQPSVGNLYRLADLLDVEVSELLISIEKYRRIS